MEHLVYSKHPCCFVSWVCWHGHEKSHTTRICSPHNILFMCKSAEAVTIMGTAADVLGWGFCLILVLSGGNSFLFNHFVKNESIIAFLWEDSHFRLVDGHLSSRFGGAGLLTLQEIKNLTQFQVLSFKVLLCISLSIRVCLRHSLQVMHGLKAIFH